MQYIYFSHLKAVTAKCCQCVSLSGSVFSNSPNIPVFLMWQMKSFFRTWKQFEKPIKLILSSNLSIVICYALNFFQMVFIQFNAILITHNHIFLKRNSSISTSISFVKELTQSCNDLSFHCLLIIFTFKASEIDVYFTSMLSSITNIFCYNRHHSSVWSQINLIIVMSAEKYIYVNEDIYSKAFFVLDFPACRFISD